ncbi:MAG TPA: OsmC family protein [Gemmatales bacterium]|nr:OsmC family protein [Gemmatales bacterium]
MIRASCFADTNRSAFTNGSHSGFADVPLKKGGNGNGFGPHELLEAALATCMTITVSKYAEQHQLPMLNVECEVTADRSVSDVVTLQYSLKLDGELSLEQEQRLRQAAVKCPVAKTLTGIIAFKPLE